MIPSKRLIVKGREGNKSVGTAQRRNKSKIINSKNDSPTENFKHAKIKKQGMKRLKGARDSTPSIDRSSLSPESRLA